MLEKHESTVGSRAGKNRSGKGSRSLQNMFPVSQKTLQSLDFLSNGALINGSMLGSNGRPVVIASVVGRRGADS